MRKHMTAAALTAATALVLAACGSAEPGDTGDGGDGGDGGGETLTIGIKYDQPGLGLQKGADYVGFDVDVARYVADKLGYGEDQLEFVEAVSANRETMLQNGDVDMIFATYSITDDRKEVVEFAGPYFVAGQDLLVAANDDSITGPEDLEGKNLCSVTGSTSAERIKEEYAEGVELVERPGYSECVSALASGAVDAVTTDDIILAGLAAAQEDPTTFKVVGNPFSEENYGVGLPQGSTDLCEEINTAITEMIEDGTWEELVATHTDGTGYVANEELNPPEPDACA
ncbi:glutamate ABC transporter substrate-binding protein [Myceligenerans pegani]|uniref:Glutamate ABC transporter substrate-binding protein n=1 Tax=Myceligenerans pegani TaxID=2776917 RepID=A0ABR9MYE1_9MICO|nr:glutamate ABC transporter substrate-binding protein [Myceligenerans sp. TRM 65318]MBE1876408.1 glutamate ABC transporter substrate-binding protein [Myceligenerans sp. TRM 65318]MBE3018679.1 glutamate ABC transporter substrate-binding protein [Myceligenerans sp. TRM 65318]